MACRAAATDATDAGGGLRSYAHLDEGRAERTGVPEVVYGEGKTPEQVLEILKCLKGGIATRVSKEAWEEIKSKAAPDDLPLFSYSDLGRVLSYSPPSTVSKPEQAPPSEGSPPVVAIVTAGTTDIQVAEEAYATLNAAQIEATRLYDCGVAGLHRVISHLPELTSPSVSCVIVVAGMDGALPSVVSGLVKCPVIAVPTSVGYGAHLGGVSAMLTMINSCSPGVTVVNVDNGFGAAAAAFKICNVGRDR